MNLYNDIDKMKQSKLINKVNNEARCKINANGVVVVALMLFIVTSVIKLLDMLIRNF